MGHQVGGGGGGGGGIKNPGLGVMLKNFQDWGRVQVFLGVIVVGVVSTPLHAMV